MRVLITGGAGFIGSHLAEALLGLGHDVHIIDDLSTGRMENFVHLRAHPRFHFAIETIHNEMVMDRLASECEVIYHLAAAVGVELIVQDPVHVIETNIVGSENVLRVANRYRRKVFLASTSEVYGKSEKVPFLEEDDSVLGPTVKSRWSYACSKAIDEFLALAFHKQYGLPVVIARLFNTVGPRQTGQYGMVLPRFIQKALQNEPLQVYGDGGQSRCFTYVQDIVEAVVRLVDCPEAQGQVFNLGSTEEVTILDLARKVIAQTGSRSEIRFLPYDQAYEAGFEDMRRRVPDISKAGRTIGYRPKVSLEEIIRRMVEHARKEEPSRHA
jgi:UDP-glucose 4-epimerase